VKADTKPSVIWNLLIRRWKLDPPSVLLAVLGDFEEVDKAWQCVTNGSWIITTGSSPYTAGTEATTIGIIGIEEVAGKEKFYAEHTEVEKLSFS